VTGAGPAPFGGLRVIELAHDEIAYCGKLFANQGADVVLVEPPGGDRSRAYGPFAGDRPDPEGSLHFWHYHTSKRSVILDITIDEDRQALLRLLDTADVLLEAEGPGRLATAGLSFEALLARNPRLVIGSVTPFGDDGPYAGHLSSDLTALSMGGIVHMCGYDDHSLPPIRPMGNQAWHTASHQLYIGVLLALVGRQTTGRGQRAHISMHEATSVTTEFTIPMWEVIRKNLVRQTGRHAYDEITEPAQFPTKDGGYVYMLLKTDDAAWNGLLGWLREHDMVADLDGPEYASRTLRQQKTATIMPLMGALAQEYTADEFYLKAQSIGQPWAMIKTPDEAMVEEHHVERGFPQAVEHPERGATYMYPGAPWIASATPYRIRRRAPFAGEHTAEVLGEGA
jgi:crotonobetainyl-CoA:carnitine CoA-transferase CaiB-like acyl-CoA transferase